MELDEEYILGILVDAAMGAERLTPSDFDERYCKDMEGGYPITVMVPAPMSRLAARIVDTAGQCPGISWSAVRRGERVGGPKQDVGEDPS
jgi:hypothetical protein